MNSSSFFPELAFHMFQFVSDSESCSKVEGISEALSFQAASTMSTLFNFRSSYPE